jgi:hypothetical protein
MSYRVSAAMKRRLQNFDKKNGGPREFWRNVDKSAGENGPWLWVGDTNNNHNTVDCDSYDYGQFNLEGHRSKMAHRISLFLTFGCEVPSTHDVFPLIGKNHLDVNPYHLGVRDRKTGTEMSAAEYFAANDNLKQCEARVAA